MVGAGNLTILAVGDVHVDRADPPSVFSQVAGVLRQADIVIGNLEGANCDRGDPIPGKIEVGSFNLRSAPQNVKALESAGFNAMILANNHIMDFGPEGLGQCMGLLDELKIAHAGAGRNLEEAHKPAILERKGTKVALLAYTSIFIPAGNAAEGNKPGVATIRVGTSYQAPENVLYQPGFPALVTTLPDPADQAAMEADVQRAKQDADIVLVAFHWGVSNGYGRVVGYQKELGRAAIDAGADLVMGGHPHALDGMEMYKGRLICYSMGNFVMDGFGSAHHGADTIILKCRIQDKEIVHCSFIPAHITPEWEPHVLDREQGLRVMNRIEAKSADFGTIFSMKDGEVTISGPKPDTPQAQRGFNVEPHRGLPVLVDSILQLPYLAEDKKLKARYGKKWGLYRKGKK